MERRELLMWMVATGGLAAFNRLSIDDLEALGEATHHSAQQRVQPPRMRARVGLRALSAQAAATMTTAAERIIPASDTPGATHAGVTAFIDVMLVDWYTAADRTRFLAGIAELDARARQRTAPSFVAANEADQVAILVALDDEITALRRTNATAANDHWFGMLKYLTIWGYCTSEAGMRHTLKLYPPPMRYDGAAPVAPR
jgi:Gluconate 2-dehydrogenase subunit 3